jgi:hypothetical protein
MRRPYVALFVAMLVAAGCGSAVSTQTNAGLPVSHTPAGATPSGATPTESNPTQAATPTEAQASGGGTITVTMQGSNFFVQGGDCAWGIGHGYFVAEAGDWIDGNDPSSTADFVSIDIYPDGHAEHGGGSVAGTRFFFNTSGETGTGDPTTGGTFSGTDDYGHGKMTGVFTCQ